jgi:plastocyanin
MVRSKRFAWSRVIAVAVLGLAATPTLAADGAAPQRVEIVLANFSFTPASLKLSNGEKVTLHFVNQGSGGHNYSAPEFFKVAKIAPESAGAVKDGTVELKKGASVDVTLVPAAGHYPVKCTHFLHAGFGMKGDITVS